MGTPHGERLAQEADALAFGRDEPSEEQAATVWQLADAAVAALGEGVSRHERVRTAVNLQTSSSDPGKVATLARSPRSAALCRGATPDPFLKGPTVRLLLRYHRRDGSSADLAVTVDGELSVGELANGSPAPTPLPRRRHRI